MPKAIDITGQKFGTLTVIEKAPSRSGKTYWKCECECGAIKEVQTGHLKSGAIQSCGNPQCKQLHNSAEMIKYCEICGKEFPIVANAMTRKYCYDCSPPANGHRADTITALR
jgi:hypothetical protein